MKTITKADGGSKSENVRHLIPICYRNGESRKLEITDVGYDGLLEAKTMRRVNKLFLEKAGSGYFASSAKCEKSDDRNRLSDMT